MWAVIFHFKGHTHLWKKRSPLGSTVTWWVGMKSWLFLNQDTWAVGLLYGGLQVTVTFSPCITVMFVGCWMKLQSMSGITHACLHLHLSIHTHYVWTVRYHLYIDIDPTTVVEFRHPDMFLRKGVITFTLIIAHVFQFLPIRKRTHVFWLVI